MSARTRKGCEFLGWLTFVASAVCYVISAIRAGDMISVAGGVLFFAACLMFLAPLMRQADERRDER